MPNPPITFKHSFNSGDLLTILPGVKNVCEEYGRKAIIYQRLDFKGDYDHNDTHPVVDGSGIQVCMNNLMFSMIKPLIDYQNYIEELRVWRGEKVDFDLDKTRMDRQVPLNGGDIYHWPNLIFPQLTPAVHEENWIDTNPDDEQRYAFKDCILVNRTQRYQNQFIDYYFLKPFEEKIFFVGTEMEHELFCKAFNLSIRKLSVSNFYYLALFIQNCRFFIGNQSMCWHIAEGVWQKRILEVCSVFPNTFPISPNGYCFINQGSLEFYFEKLLKETE